MGTIVSGLSLKFLERPLVAVGKGLAALPRLLCVWQDREFLRGHLAGLDDRALKDMGLTRADVAQETAKPFWRE